MPHLVAPSLLSADFSELRKDIEMINHSEADWFHLDIMDGVFVPNISFGLPVVRAIKKFATKPLDVHLMITDPGRYIEDFAGAGADIITVHYEACTHLHRTMQKIKSLGIKAGVSINPATPISVLADILGESDVILIMSVNPGFGGQKFIANTYKKVAGLKAMIAAEKTHTQIEIDGGVDLSNYTRLLDAGADILVAGNTVFKAPDPTIAIHQLKTK